MILGKSSNFTRFLVSLPLNEDIGPECFMFSLALKSHDSLISVSVVELFIYLFIFWKQIEKFNHALKGLHTWKLSVPISKFSLFSFVLLWSSGFRDKARRLFFFKVSSAVLSSQTFRGVLYLFCQVWSPLATCSYWTLELWLVRLSNWIFYFI